MDMMEGVQDYEDMSEVEAILDHYREYMHFFFGIETPKERDMRDTICHELLRLTQRGNINAKDTLMTYATFTMDTWIDRNMHFTCFRALPELSKERLEKCIRGYQFWDNAGPFFGYLYASLEGQSKSIYINSLDQPPSSHISDRYSPNELYNYVITDTEDH